MKVALFTDLHIHPYARFAGLSDRGLNTWVESALQVLGDIYTYCADHGVSDVWFLGDLFHVGVRSYSRILNQVSRFFQEQQRLGFNTILVAGNHDRIARQSPETILTNFREYCLVIEGAPSVVTVRGGPEILFIPYTEDYALLSRAVENYRIAHGDLIAVGHLAVEGAVVGVNEYQPPEGCKGRLFTGFKAVLLGHYHKRQIVTPAVRYIGSAMSLDFHDSQAEKGFEILTLEDGAMSVEFVPINSTGFAVLDNSTLLSADVRNRIIRFDYAGELDEEEVRRQLLGRGAEAVVFNREVVREVEERIANPDTDEKGCINDYVERNKGELAGDRLVALGLDIAESTRA